MRNGPPPQTIGVPQHDLLAVRPLRGKGTNVPENESSKNRILTTDLFGRRVIYTPVEDLTEENVIDEVNSALVYHVQNMCEEERLYWYRRGLQPILMRKKERNKFITNFAVVNIAEEITAFHNGIFMPEPAYYVSRNDGTQSKVDQLNEFLYRSGKEDADNELKDWFHTVGKAILYVEPNDDKDAPLKCYALRPMNAFVVYSMRPGNKPAYGVSIVTADATVYLDVWTEKRLFRLKGTKRGEYATDYPDLEVIASEIVSVEPNVLGHIPLIEYQYNSIHTGAFELAINLLDQINNIQSNRIDGVEQFIQSLLIITNAELEEGETNETIKERGILLLRSTQELASKVEMLTQQLDQTQTQMLVDDIYDHVLTICGMPRTSTGGSGSGANGVAILARDGWYQSDFWTQNTINLFKKSNRRFDEILIDVLDRKGLLKIGINDFELNIARSETANIQSKAQAFQTLMAAGLHPELAAAKSGVSNDPASDIAMSEKYLKMRWGDPDAPVAAPGEDVPGMEGPDGAPSDGGGGNGGGGEAPAGGGSAGGAQSAGQTQQGKVYIKGYWQDRN